MRWYKTAFAAVLVVSVAVAGVAMAGPGRGRGQGRDDRDDHRRGPAFSDWRPGFWANEALARMSVKGVIKGNADGTIAPDRPVTKLEAAIMLTRLLGLDGEDRTSVGDILYGDGSGHFPGGKWEFTVDGDELEVNVKSRGEKFEVKMKDGRLKVEAKGPGGKFEAEFDDVDEIPEWGEAAVMAGLRFGFLLDGGQRLDLFRPLDRLDATVMLVKAAGLDAEARANAGAPLPFSDAGAIDAALRGYVAIAVENGLISGYPDNTFLPARLVTRAEWAALLDRLDRKAVEPPDSLEVRGTVTQVTLGANAAITLTTPAHPEGVTYPVDDTALFYIRGQAGTIADVQAGDRVLVQLNADQRIVMVTVQVNRSGVNANLRTGTVTALTPPGTANGSISIQSGGQTATLTVATGVAVSWNGQALAFADLRLNDRVQLTVAGGVVTHIAVQARPNVVQQGTVQSVNLTQKTFVVTYATAGSGTATATVTYTGNTEFTYGAVPLTAANLAVGQSVAVTGTLDGTVLRAGAVAIQTAATVRFAAAVTGTTPATGTQAAAISVTAGNVGVTYPVAAGATVTHGGQTVAFATVQSGDQVDLTLTGGAVTAIAIASRVPGTLEGHVTGVNLTQNHLLLQYTPAGTSTPAAATVRWSSGTTFTFQGLTITPSSLGVGQRLSVTGTWQADGSLQASAVSILQLAP